MIFFSQWYNLKTLAFGSDHLIEQGCIHWITCNVVIKTSMRLSSTYSSGQQESCTICCCIVSQPNLDAISGELMSICCTYNVISLNSCVRYLKNNKDKWLWKPLLTIPDNVNICHNATSSILRKDKKSFQMFTNYFK